jgi:sRNA-binding protein
MLLALAGVSGCGETTAEGEAAAQPTSQEEEREQKHERQEQHEQQQQEQAEESTTAPSSESPSSESSEGSSGEDEEVGSSSQATDAQFCSEHECVGSFATQRDTIVECSDGSYSHAGGIRGACSHHGGES